MKYILIGFYVLCVQWVAAQQQGDSLLTKNFVFQDGVYFQLSDLRQNQPSVRWDSTRSNLFTNPQTYLTKVAYIIHQGDTINLENIWGLVLGGIPYIRLADTLDNSGLTFFAGLRVRGNICYFSYEKEIQTLEPMQAYNPLTRKPFLTAQVERTKVYKVEKMLRFETGAIADFNVANFLEWIQNDPALSASVREIPPAALPEKLFKSLLIYDDRHPVFVGQ